MENQQLQQVTNDYTSLQLRAEIDSAVSTAKAFPRSITLFMQKAMSMATITEDIAASCTYSLPRAGKDIEGPSVRLAEIVAASYGNIRAAARIVSNDGKTITAQGTCFDMENNVSAMVEVKRRITDRNGRTYNEDMQTTVGNAACSIAYRNAIYKVIPAALIAPIYEEAKRVARGDAATLIDRRNRAVDYFKSLGVTEKQICDVLELKKIDDIDLDKLQILTGMRSAIKNGETTVQSLFDPKEQVIIIEDLTMLYDMKKEAMTQEQQMNAERIINNKETPNYNKLAETLKSL